MALSYLEMDKWSSEHASCEAEHRFIIEMLNTRSYEPRTSKKYDLLSAKIRVQLKQFEGNVNNLKLKLEEGQNLTEEEKERRYRLVENLESYIIQIAQKINTRMEEEERTNLMSSKQGVLGEFGTTGWGSDEEEVGLDTSPLLADTSDQLREQHTRLLQDQEQGLDRLSKVISRQKDIAVTIGNEVDFQNDLVDNITERLDITNTCVQRETAHIQVISVKDNTCGYWMVILLLFVAILVIGIL